MDCRTDRRIAKTQTALREAFLSLLLERGFDAITVKDLTERANVSRKTFYLHYLDKYDLLNAVVDLHLADLDAVCAVKRADSVEGTIIWFRYFEQHKDFFTALFSSGSTVRFRCRLLDFIRAQLGHKLEAVDPARNTDVLRTFAAMAVLGIVESYVLGELRESTEQIATQVAQLLDQIIARPIPPAQ